MPHARPIDAVTLTPRALNCQKNLRFKRSAYIAAKHIFDKNTDVVLLCTQQLQKELMSNDPILIGIAINCLSNIATVDLAENLLPNVAEMTKRWRSGCV